MIRERGGEAVPTTPASAPAFSTATPSSQAAATRCCSSLPFLHERPVHTRRGGNQKRRSLSYRYPLCPLYTSRSYPSELTSASRLRQLSIVISASATQHSHRQIILIRYTFLIRGHSW
jgi:hypothetical protein